MQLRAYGVLCMYAVVLVNTIPRVADAAFGTVMFCMNIGFGFVAAAAVVFVLSAWKDSAVRAAAGPVELRES